MQIARFDTFKQAARAAWTGFNPQAGTKIKIAAQKAPKCVPGASFKAAVDPQAAKRKQTRRRLQGPSPKGCRQEEVGVPQRHAASDRQRPLGPLF